MSYDVFGPDARILVPCFKITEFRATFQMDLQAITLSSLEHVRISDASVKSRKPS